MLRGERAGDLPVEQPTKFELIAYPKDRHRAFLTISPGVLVRADKAASGIGNGEDGRIADRQDIEASLAVQREREAIEVG